MKLTLGAFASIVLTTLIVACSPAPAPDPEAVPEAQPESTAMAGSAALEGTEWIADSISGIPTAEGVETTISFQAEGKVGGSAGCNSFFGSWAAEGNAITFGHVGATKMMCPPPQMDQEDRFFAALGQAERFEIRDGALLIFSTGAAEPIRLRPLELAEMERSAQ
jgi:putative lipoprotein